MRKIKHWLGYILLTICSVFAGTALIVCNPGYFWDDWVWIYQSNSSNIQIGKELGIYWAGYLTNFINSLATPVLLLRIVALVFWIIAGGCMAGVFYRHNLLRRRDAFLLFLMNASLHVSLVRFINSVSLYNVYIASFWIGVVLLYTKKESKLRRYTSFVFFFFSFYLNSMLMLYFFLVAIMFFEFARNEKIIFITKFESIYAIFSKLKFGLCKIVSGKFDAKVIRGFVCKYLTAVYRFVKFRFSFVVIPVLFVFVKFSTKVPSAIYGNYNEIQKQVIFSSLWKSFILIKPVLGDYFNLMSLSGNPSSVILGSCVIVFIFLQFIQKNDESDKIEKTLCQVGIGALLFVVAVYPYVLVGKNPDLQDFYESRHIMPAVPGMLLMLIGLTNMMSILLRNFYWVNRFLRDIIFAVCIGGAIGKSALMGCDLWRDWLTQVAFMDFASDNKAKLGKYGTFVIDDKTTGMRIGNRIILNYEYTGNLINVFGGRDHLGISLNEYQSWEPNVGLIRDSVLKNRYNIKNYNFTRPHIIVSVSNSNLEMSNKQVLRLAWLYLSGGNYKISLSTYFNFNIAPEYNEVDVRIKEMQLVADALSVYRREHGVFPVSFPLSKDGLSTLAINKENSTSHIASVNNIPGLFPRYMKRPSGFVNVSQDSLSRYIYYSDGNDYKLLYSQVEDMAYARQSHPFLIDEANKGYGVWTLDAKNW